MIYASEQGILNERLNAAYQSFLVEAERIRPFMLLKPKMFIDGNKWCALYGKDLQNGVCAFGDTPDEASKNFDMEWKKGTVIK